MGSLPNPSRLSGCSGRLYNRNLVGMYLVLSDHPTLWRMLPQPLRKVISTQQCVCVPWAHPNISQPLARSLTLNLKDEHQLVAKPDKPLLVRRMPNEVRTQSAPGDVNAAVQCFEPMKGRGVRSMATLSRSLTALPVDRCSTGQAYDNKSI